MAFTRENVVWSAQGQAFGCPEAGVGCEGRSGVSPNVGGMALQCSHADCPVKHRVVTAGRADNPDVELAKLPTIVE